MCLEAGFELVADPARPNAHRVHCETQPSSELAASLDLGALLAPVVLENELPIMRRELLQATFETVELSPPDRVVWVGRPCGLRRQNSRTFVERDIAALGSADVLQKHELRDDVAITGRRSVRDRALFLQPAGHPVQRFVSQLIR